MHPLLVMNHSLGYESLCKPLSHAAWSVMLQAGKKWEALGMSSVEGEYVEFAAPITLDGPVEVGP